MEPSENNFLTRGCNREPKPYERNSDCYKAGCAKLSTYNWLKNVPLPPDQGQFEIVEIRFKNSRKDFFRKPPELTLEEGDFVAVEASPGHDIGIVSLTGEAVKIQLKKKGVDPYDTEIKKVYRRVKTSDIEKWVNVVAQEESAKHKTRKAVAELTLDMKVNDVEYQGDRTKAIFYYTAEDRVDFRELIKVLAEKFGVRIEMKQIGVRQEAARLGGIGSCGRELCCATWLFDFYSVTTQAARDQQLSLNPQKLAGQCGKLKCCLNYEYEVYLDAYKNFPPTNIPLKTKKGNALFHKFDIFKKAMWYAYESDPNNLLAISGDKVKEIQELNSKNQLIDKLEDFALTKEEKIDFENVVGQDDLTRFDD